MSRKKRSGQSEVPPARSERLLISQVGDELLVYDQDRDKVHCLNRFAALVWNSCREGMTLKQLRSDLEDQLQDTAHEEAVVLALKELSNLKLLQSDFLHAPVNSRREILLKLGKVAVVGIPVITSIVAPLPTHAGSCLAFGESCTDGAECCSGFCLFGTCGVVFGK